MTLGIKIFRINTRITNYFAKLGHHIFNVYGNNKYSGNACLLVGVPFILIGGLSQVLAIEKSSGARIVGWVTLSIGIALVALPLIVAISLAFGDDPKNK